jgi:membrane protein DedA with SNARE-associated domain
VIVATLAGEAGGLLGYSIGNRWGRQLLERPGKHQAGRQKIVERGEVAYARWGRLAVFFTPAIVSGTAKMKYGQFVLWNLLAALGFATSVGTSAYGIGRVVTGHDTLKDVGILVLGLAVGVLVAVIFVQRRHRSRTDDVG